MPLCPVPSPPQHGPGDSAGRRKRQSYAICSSRTGNPSQVTQTQHTCSFSPTTPAAACRWAEAPKSGRDAGALAQKQRPRTSTLPMQRQQQVGCCWSDDHARLAIAPRSRRHDTYRASGEISASSVDLPVEHDGNGQAHRGQSMASSARLPLPSRWTRTQQHPVGTGRDGIAFREARSPPAVYIRTLNAATPTEPINQPT